MKTENKCINTTLYACCPVIKELSGRLQLQFCLTLQDELDSVDTSVVISSCSLAEARHLLDHFLKASIDKVSFNSGNHRKHDNILSYRLKRFEYKYTHYSFLR